MRIVCPSCGATYDVPDAMLAAGRPVRCAKCGEKWLPSAEPEPEPERRPEPVEAMSGAQPGPSFDFDSDRPPPSDAAPIEGVFTRLTDGPLTRLAPSPPAAKRPMVLALLGWLATIAILAGLGSAGVVWRLEVMQHWPPSERLYAALGLDR